MAGNLQPLVNNQRIVRDDGTPTDYFIRWAQQKQIDISGGITAAEAQQLIDDWALSRSIISGIGLSGGGNLSTDRTIDLENTLVTPGIYGDATHVSQFTVDAQGRLVNASNIPITGGGGGGSTYLISSWYPVSQGGNTAWYTPFLLPAGKTITGGEVVFFATNPTLAFFAGIYNATAAGLPNARVGLSAVQTGCISGNINKIPFITPYTNSSGVDQLMFMAQLYSTTIAVGCGSNPYTFTSGTVTLPATFGGVSGSGFGGTPATIPY